MNPEYNSFILQTMILDLTGEFKRLVSQRRRARSRSGASSSIGFNTHVFSESAFIVGLKLSCHVLLDHYGC